MAAVAAMVCWRGQQHLPDRVGRVDGGHGTTMIGSGHGQGEVVGPQGLAPSYMVAAISSLPAGWIGAGHTPGLEYAQKPLSLLLGVVLGRHFRRFSLFCIN